MFNLMLNAVITLQRRTAVLFVNRLTLSLTLSCTHTWNKIECCRNFPCH